MLKFIKLFCFIKFLFNSYIIEKHRPASCEFLAEHINTARTKWVEIIPYHHKKNLIELWNLKMQIDKLTVCSVTFYECILLLYCSSVLHTSLQFFVCCLHAFLRCFYLVSYIVHVAEVPTYRLLWMLLLSGYFFMLLSPGGSKRIVVGALIQMRRQGCGAMLASHELVAPIFPDTQTPRHAALPTRS